MSLFGFAQAADHNVFVVGGQNSTPRCTLHLQRSLFFSFFLIILRQEEKQELPSASCGTDSGRAQDRAQPRRGQLNRVGNTASYSIRCSICMSQGAGSRRQMETTLSRLGLCDVTGAECACRCPPGACGSLPLSCFSGGCFFFFPSSIPRLTRLELCVSRLCLVCVKVASCRGRHGEIQETQTGQTGWAGLARPISRARRAPDLRSERGCRSRGK